MDREFLLTTLDYRSTLMSHDRDFAIQNLRDALLRVVQLTWLRVRITCLPEPVDLLTLSNHEDPMHPELRAGGTGGGPHDGKRGGGESRPWIRIGNQIHVPRLKSVWLSQH
jgi:hypothetical protein